MSKDIWRCPECETLNTEDNCLICGCEKVVLKHPYCDNTATISEEVIKIKFSPAEKTDTTIIRTPQVDINERSVWYCSKCGMQNSRYEHKCNRCGFDRLKILNIIVGSIVLVIALIIGILLLCL